MGHRFCQWNLGLCMALVACLVLCLGPGAETLKCKRCHGKTSEECLKKAEDKDCREGDRCAVQLLHYLPDDELRSVVMECWEKSSPCGVKERKGSHQLTFKCCSDRDFCNKDLFSA